MEKEYEERAAFELKAAEGKESSGDESNLNVKVAVSWTMHKTRVQRNWGLWVAINI